MTPTEREALFARVEELLAPHENGSTSGYVNGMSAGGLRSLLTLARKVEALEKALRLARPWIERARYNAGTAATEPVLAQIDAALGDTPT